MIEGKFLKSEDNFSDSIEIRKKVFVEEMGFTVESISDGRDSESEHVIVFNEEHKVVAAGRLSLINKQFWINQVAVLKEERGKYYGDFVVRMLVDKVFRNEGEEVWVKADENSTHFFIKLGFTVLENVLDENKYKWNIMSLNKCHLFKKCGK
jgi:predicted GNAT family N-acyltransferase